MSTWMSWVEHHPYAAGALEVSVFTPEGELGFELEVYRLPHAFRSFAFWVDSRTGEAFAWAEVGEA